METNVTNLFLREMRWKRNRLNGRIVRWFGNHARTQIIYQCGVFWFLPAYDLIPKYVKQAVRRFMKGRCHAELIEDWPPEAA